MSWENVFGIYEYFPLIFYVGRREEGVQCNFVAETFDI